MAAIREKCDVEVRWQWERAQPITTQIKSMRLEAFQENVNYDKIQCSKNFLKYKKQKSIDFQNALKSSISSQTFSSPSFSLYLDRFTTPRPFPHPVSSDAHFLRSVIPLDIPFIWPAKFDSFKFDSSGCFRPQPGRGYLLSTPERAPSQVVPSGKWSI